MEPPSRASPAPCLPELCTNKELEKAPNATALLPVAIKADPLLRTNCCDPRNITLVVSMNRAPLPTCPSITSGVFSVKIQF